MSGSGGEMVKRLMRDFKGMKRQRGRNRGGNSGGGNSGGGGKPQHNVNRAFESNGPDNVKIRGNAQHVFEKYQQLARDATAAGDRVLGENYLQHAEHYFRVIRAVQPNKTTSEIMGRDSFASGYDIDFEDESGAQAAAEEAPSEGGDNQGDGGEGGEQRAERQDRDQNREWRDRRDERPRDDRQQGDRQQTYNREDRYDRDRPRDDRPREDRQRDDRPRDDRPRDDRPRDERPRDDRPRDERPREDRPRDDRPQGDRPPRRERFRDRDRPRDDRPRDPMAVVEPESTPLTPAAEADTGPRLRSQDGSESHAPAFLQARPPAATPAPEASAEDGEAKKPRRRRAPRSFEGGEGEAPVKTETEEA
jgi:hypothetical protein